MDTFTNTALHAAASEGRIDTVHSLIRQGHDINSYSLYFSTPLILAVNRAGRINPLDSPLFTQIHDHCDIYTLRYALDTCLEYTAMRYRDLEVSAPSYYQTHATIDLLLRSGAEVNKAGIGGRTALHMAVLGEEPEIIQKLIAAGADLEARTSDGMTPLLLAAVRGNFHVIDLLVRCGAKIQAVDKRGRTALLILVSTEGCPPDERSVRLLARDKHLLNVPGPHGFTPLMNAAFHLKLNTVRVLLDLGANPNIVVRYATKPLTVLGIFLFLADFHLQQNNLFMHCVEELIQLGALQSLPEHCYSSILRLVAGAPQEFVQMLLTHGFVPKSVYILNMGEHGGYLSPFGVSLLNNNLDVVEFFNDNWFLTTEDLVGSENLKSLIDLIRRHGNPQSVSFLKKFKKQPMSLEQLSFTVVSSHLGDMAGREDRVRQLEVPTILQDKLLFRR